MWRAEGTALHDHIGAGYNLLRLGQPAANTAKLEQAIRETGAPITVHEVREPDLREMYGADLVLLRPDLHIAWCGDTAPADAAELAELVTGRLRREGRPPAGASSLHSASRRSAAQPPLTTGRTAVQQVKAVVAETRGKPVEVRNILVPDPGPGEALVRVQACGVCHTDLHYRDGGIGDEAPTSWVTRPQAWSRPLGQTSPAWHPVTS